MSGVRKDLPMGEAQQKENEFIQDEIRRLEWGFGWLRYKTTMVHSFQRTVGSPDDVKSR